MTSLKAKEFAGLELTNAFTVAPMTRISADSNGCANQQMADYYERFAEGGFGLVITEGTYPDKEASQGYINQPGIADVPQTEAWKAVVDKVHAQGAKIILQIMHAGAQLQYNAYTEQPVAPSAVKPKGAPLGFYGDQDAWPEVNEMGEHDFDLIMNGFVGAVKRAHEAGFDGVELHAANGYLLNAFLSTHFNQREDQWGGPIERRAEFLLKIIKPTRAAVPDSLLVGVRLSQIRITDNEYNWPEGESGFQWLVEKIKQAGASFIHTTDASVNRAALKDSDKSLAEVVRDANIPLIINGGIDETNYQELAEHYPDALLALGKKALANPDFVERLKGNDPIADIDFAMLQPKANLDNEAKWRAENAS